MSIGSSSGAFFKDEFHRAIGNDQNVMDPEIDPDTQTHDQNEITPGAMMGNKEVLEAQDTFAPGYDEVKYKPSQSLLKQQSDQREIENNQRVLDFDERFPQYQHAPNPIEDRRDMDIEFKANKGFWKSPDMPEGHYTPNSSLGDELGNKDLDVYALTGGKNEKLR